MRFDSKGQSLRVLRAGLDGRSQFALPLLVASQSSRISILKPPRRQRGRWKQLDTLHSQCQWMLEMKSRSIRLSKVPSLSMAGSTYW